MCPDVQMRKRTMGISDDVHIHFSLAENQVCGTDWLHRTDRHGNTEIGKKEV